jgi:acylphosphatase
MPTIHLYIKGEVQGVFFRATAKKIADALNITGWIKNTNNGEVEAMVTGSQEQLGEFVKWCKHGPEKAVVEDVDIIDEDETVFDDFVVIRGRSS